MPIQTRHKNGGRFQEEAGGKFVFPVKLSDFRPHAFRKGSYLFTHLMSCADCNNSHFLDDSMGFNERNTIVLWKTLVLSILARHPYRLIADTQWRGIDRSIRERKMIRLVSTVTFAASLLLWSTLVFADSPNTTSGEAAVTADAVPPVQHQSVQSQHVHNHSSVQPFPVLNNIGHNLNINTTAERINRFGTGMVGRFRNAASFPLAASGFAWQPGAAPGTVPMPAGPPPNGFIGGVFAPQQYQQMPPYPVMAGYYPQGPVGSPPSYVPPQGGEIPLPELIDPNGYVYPGSTGYMEESPVPDLRIVYVPYAMPPPIHVERFAKTPRPPLMRRVLGDAALYEYPEMPLRMYTTRGPRDFLATNPPSIGY